jgi:hypothetical protein
MSIKKYDRFERDCDGKIIETAGIYDERNHVFKDLGRNGFYIFSEERLRGFGFKKIPRDSYSHPLLSEIGAELKDNPAFKEQLIKFAVDLISIASAEDKNEVFELFKKHIPVEWLMTLETMTDMDAWRG